MRHDPLCIIASLDPTSYDYEERAYYECQCHLVARVRDDERRWYTEGLDRIIREVDTPPRQPKEHINPTGYDPAATDNRP